MMLESGRTGRTTGNTSILRALLEIGQSVWLDALQRSMTRWGRLAALVRDGLRGICTPHGASWSNCKRPASISPTRSLPWSCRRSPGSVGHRTIS